MNLGTHAYVGSLPCGCGVTFSSDRPDRLEGSAVHVMALLRNGYVVRWLPRDDALTVASAHCANYPHEEWQRAYVRRLRAFQGDLRAYDEPA